VRIFAIWCPRASNSSLIHIFKTILQNLWKSPKPSPTLNSPVISQVIAFYDCFHVQEQYTACFNCKEPKHLLTSNTWENEDMSYKHCAFKKVLNKQVFHHMKLQTQISMLTRDQPRMSSRRNHTTGDLRAWGTLLGGYWVVHDGKNPCKFLWDYSISMQRYLLNSQVSWQTFTLCVWAGVRSVCNH
jgi:hypothetical protein